jgi:hypothetical protein
MTATSKLFLLLLLVQLHSTYVCIVRKQFIFQINSPQKNLLLGTVHRINLKIAENTSTYYIPVPAIYHESSSYKFFKWVELPKDNMRHSRIVQEDFIGNNGHKN